MGTIKTTNIEPIADNGTVTLGSSGDTFTIPSGVTMVNNGTQTGFGGTMTPAFSAYLSSAQSLGNNVNTTIICDTELFDTNNMYDTSTGVFTPTVAGKYFLYAKLFYSGAQNEGIADLYLQKNGTTGVSAFRLRPSGSSGQAIQVSGYGIANGSTDTFSLQTYHAAGSGITAESGGGKTIFSAFKIIE